MKGRLLRAEECGRRRAGRLPGSALSATPPWEIHTVAAVAEPFAFSTHRQAPSAEYVIPSDLLSCRFLLPSPPWGIARTERMGRAITRDASETVGLWAGALTFGALLSSAKHEGWASLQSQKGNSAFFFLPHCSHSAPRHQWKPVRPELQLSVFGVGMAWLTFLLIKSRREQINPTMSDLVNWG